MKVFVLAAAAAAVAMPASPATGTNENTIIVGAPTIPQWSRTVGAKLERNLRAIQATPLADVRIPSGVVSLRFHCSEEGVPTAIEYTQRSDSADLNAIARRSVAKLRNLHPLPAGVGDHQVFEATIIVASDRDQFDRQLAAFRERAAAQYALGSPRPNVLALAVGLNPQAHAYRL